MTRILTLSEQKRLKEVAKDIELRCKFLNSSSASYIRYFALYRELNNMIILNRADDDFGLTALEYFMKNTDVQAFINKHVLIADNVVQLNRN